MAIASITHTWADGTKIRATLDSGDDTAHPDLLDELVSRVLVMYRGAIFEDDDG